MKALLVLVLGIYIFWPPAPEKAVASVESNYSIVTYYYANRITKFFKKRGCVKKMPCGDPQWILQFTAEQLRWMRFFGIEHTAEKFLSNTVAESWYNPYAVSEDGCTGATQVCSIILADNLLKKRGINISKLGPFQRDAAQGVAIYWFKLQRANGEPWDAVQRYNGAGSEARAHRNKVWKYYREIFG